MLIALTMPYHLSYMIIYCLELTLWENGELLYWSIEITFILFKLIINSVFFSSCPLCRGPIVARVSKEEFLNSFRSLIMFTIFPYPSNQKCVFCCHCIQTTSSSYAFKVDNIYAMQLWTAILCSLLRHLVIFAPPFWASL